MKGIMIFMTRIGIVGGGIIGMTLAYYLSKESNLEVTLFDDGNQATKAAVGIICPWLNQRRNKYWYELVSSGAEFYDTLISDLKDDSFYDQVGALYINPKMEEKIYTLALKRAEESYKVGHVLRVNKLDNANLTPENFKWESGIFVSGAARVDGEILLNTLMQASLTQGLKFRSKKVFIKELGDFYEIDGEEFDKIVLTPGAHLKELMRFKPEYFVDLRAQKGQLINFKIKDNDDEYPVIMPKGEIDLLFGKKGQLVVGASHENDYKDDSVDWKVLENLKKEAIKHYPDLEKHNIMGHRLGLRAHNSTFTPFYGSLKEDPNIYVASGLGSSGLSSGPIMAYRLAQTIIDLDESLDYEFNADDYVCK